jgi:hypothetical protein
MHFTPSSVLFLPTTQELTLMINEAIVISEKLAKKSKRGIKKDISRGTVVVSSKSK